MYIVVHALCALLYVAFSACLYIFVLSPALRRSQLKWSGSRKEQTANQSAPGLLEDAGLRLGDHPSLMIPSHRYEPGFGSLQSWASFVSCLLVVTVGMLSFPSSTSYSSDGSWKLVIKVKSPARSYSGGNVSVANSKTSMTLSLSYPETRSIQSA